ncbi:MAG: TIGR03747 family integrating conjugative element membrane protein [Gammaproteobacteria bacterium]|nr:TIGR03747 family integrating conjugative element membrane protein [Gammaproteobacteria bacterium]
MSTHQEENADRGKTVQKKQALFWRVLGGCFYLIGLTLMAWLFSIVVEWVGMIFFWAEEGAGHSRQMFLTELTYLNDGFKNNFMGYKPVEMAMWLSTSITFWIFEWTRFVDLLEWSMYPSPGASEPRLDLAHVAQWAGQYFTAAMNSTQVFGVRLAVAILCLPAFIMVGFAALIDGLVERELRRFGGGNESSFVYHNVKSWMRPTVIGSLFIYLSMPVSVHPNLIFVPAIIMYGGAIYLTSATFKKYL